MNRTFLYIILHDGIEKDNFTRVFETKAQADAYCAYINKCYAKGMNCTIEELPTLYKVAIIAK